MSSLITTDIIRYEHPNSTRIYRSHVLHPQSDIAIICIISSAKESITSVVEDHILETISGSEWKHGEEDSDFSYVTENYNHFLTNLAVSDEETVSLIFAVERNGNLMVSSIGECEVILQEKGETPSNIHEDTRGHHRFELISSGEIPEDSSIFILSKNLEGSLGDTFFTDSSSLASTEFANITSEVLSRELRDTVHIVRIKRTASRTIRGHETAVETPKWRTFLSHMSHKTRKIQESHTFHTAKNGLTDLIQKHQNIFMSLFLIFGVIIFFGLISYLISALFDATTNQTKDAKNQIIEAKNLIESSQKLISNESSFDATISAAESILSELETKGLYIKDVQEQRDKIEAMKKEIYDIQSFSLEGKTTIVPFEQDKLEPLGISEKEKKITVIGKKASLYNYALGDTNLNIKGYPNGEIAKDYTALDDGNFYILTESNNIIASRKNSDITYINVSGQEGWEKADGISTFNNNIYLWNKVEGQIYKHRPGLNGFSAKASVLPNPSSGIVDIGIDGGFYILKEDGKILRYLSSANSQSGIMLNKIPGEYSVGKNPSQTKLFIRNDLNYIYILDDDTVWVFQPDSKRFQDIKSWTYVAQIEIQSKNTIHDISIVRDGLIYILTDSGVYDMVYEIVDNHVILRS